MESLRWEYNYDISKAHDTAFYMTTYFFEHEVSARLQVCSKNSADEIMSAYHEFRQKNEACVLPGEIMPFVYTNYGKGVYSFLTYYINNNLNYLTCTKADVFELLNDSALMKRQFFEYITPKGNSKTVEQLMQVNTTDSAVILIDDVGFEGETKLHVIKVVHNFDKYHKLLVKTFKMVYCLVDELFVDSQETLDELKQQVEDEEYSVVERLRSVFKFSDEVKSFSFYFSLLNPYLLHYKVYKSDVCFGLGMYFKDVIERQLHAESVSLLAYNKLMSDELNHKIVQLFLKYKKLSISSIRELLDIRESIIRLRINNMGLHGLIMCAERPASVTGKTAKILYKINPQYFIVISNKIIQQRIEAMKVSKEGISGHVTRKGNQKKLYQISKNEME